MPELASPLAGTARLPRAEASLEWLVDWRLWPALPRRAPFLERRAFRPRWAPGVPTLPPTQVAWLPPPLGYRLLAAIRVGDTGDLAAASGRRGPRRASAGALLIYHGRSHGSLRPAESCRPWTLYISRHGVAVQDRPRHRFLWAFVSTGVGKLRWPSLGRVACDASRGLLVLERSRGPAVPRELWVVRPEAGMMGRLPTGPRPGAWRLDSAHRTLQVSGSKTYPLALLMRALSPELDPVDMDGDGRPDPIRVRFSGGAHCCYRYAIHSSRAGRVFSLPLFQDGGRGGAQTIADPGWRLLADFTGDGLADLALHINTYNGRPRALSPALRRLGVHTHRVVISLAGGKLRIRDL